MKEIFTQQVFCVENSALRKVFFMSGICHLYPMPCPSFKDNKIKFLLALCISTAHGPPCPTCPARPASRGRITRIPWRWRRTMRRRPRRLGLPPPPAGGGRGEQAHRDLDDPGQHLVGGDVAGPAGLGPHGPGGGRPGAASLRGPGGRRGERCIKTINFVTSLAAHTWRGPGPVSARAPPPLPPGSPG